MTVDKRCDKRPSGETIQSEPFEAAASSRATAPPPCDVRRLNPAADRIADGVSSVASVLAEAHRTRGWKPAWDRTKSMLVIASIVVGGGFALEQYLASHYEAAKARVEARFASASDALASSDRVLHANAVRTLHRISEFATYDVPTGSSSLGRHLRAAIFGLPQEYPYFEQAWLLFRDVATARREASDQVLSSALLREGAAWEHRIRKGGTVPVDWARGSLLFQAYLAGARGADLDLRGIQFGAADLSGADLSESNCTECGLLGARLQGVTLRSTVLDSAFLSEAILNGADLSFAKMPRAVLRKAQAVEVTFLQTDLTGAELAGALLDGATFSQAVLTRTDFRDSSLRGVRFLQTDLSSAIFDGADVQAADFTRAVRFSESVLRHARNVDKALLPQPPDSKETRR